MEKNRSCRRSCVWDAHSNYMRKEQCIDYHSWLWFYSWCCWRVFFKHDYAIWRITSAYSCVFACVLSQELVRHQTLPAWQSVQTEWLFRPCWKTQWGSSIGALTLQDYGCISEGGFHGCGLYSVHIVFFPRWYWICTDRIVRDHADAALIAIWVYAF